MGAIAGRVEWRFGVLGPLTAERAGAPVHVPGIRPRTLLAVLLMQHGRPLSAKQLADELWGDRMPPSATSALHVHLSKLRAIVGDLLVGSPAGYALDIGRYRLDVDDFDAFMVAAREDRTQARTLADRALALWRADPLCDLAVERSLARWSRALADKLVEATVLRIDLELAAGNAAAVVSELEELVGRHRLEERFWEQLMLALYRSGHRARAAAVYLRAEQALLGGAGIGPGEGLRSLHARILGQAAEPSAQQLTDSWEDDLTAIAELASRPGCRVISLVGPAGVGKTRLAIEHAHRVASGAEAIPALVIDARGVADSVGLTAALAQRDFEALARGAAGLVVLDDCEPSEQMATAVAALLFNAERLQVLITATAPLMIRGEQVVVLKRARR